MANVWVFLILDIFCSGIQQRLVHFPAAGYGHLGVLCAVEQAQGNVGDGGGLRRIPGSAQNDGPGKKVPGGAAADPGAVASMDTPVIYRREVSAGYCAQISSSSSFAAERAGLMGVSSIE